MHTILVVANETLGGPALLRRLREEATAGPLRVVICVPRKRPTHGTLIYDETVFDAAQVRIDLARGVLKELGIDAIGEVGDPEPYSAAMDAIAEHHPDRIIVSTFPEVSSTWLRRDLVRRVKRAVGVAVEHIVAEPGVDGTDSRHTTLVVANRTAGGRALIDALRSSGTTTPDGRRRMLIFVAPLESGEPLAVRRARMRLDQAVDRARDVGFVAAGMTGDPDPYTATLNALELFDIDDIVISTYPHARSGWLRADLVERVRGAARRPVKHVVDESTESRA